jgi:hypothetical protein
MVGLPALLYVACDRGPNHRLGQYRPICLLNVSLMCSLKVRANRITLIANTVVKPTQTAFMHGRHILEGVVIACRFT